MTKKFGQLFEYLPKSKIKAGSGMDTGTYPFYTCSDKLTKCYDESLYNCEALIFGTGGNATMHYIDGKFSTSTDCLVAKRKSDEVLTKYVYYYLFADMNILQRGFKGSGLKHIAKSYIDEIDIPVLDLSIQAKIISVMDISLSVLKKREEQILTLDKMETDIFVELFGDLRRNVKNWNSTIVEDVCKVIVDCPHSTPKYTSINTGFYCIKTGDIRYKKINWGKAEYLAEEDFNTRIKRYCPRYQDVVYSREGAIFGMAALIDRDCNIALGQRMMLFSLERSKCNPIFFLFQMNSEAIFLQAQANVVGSASPHINIKEIRKFKFLLPPIELQNTFEEKILTIEKQKIRLELSLPELETTYKATLQKAFNGELF